MTNFRYFIFAWLILLSFFFQNCVDDEEYAETEKVVYDSDSDNPIVIDIIKKGSLRNEVNQIRKTLNYSKIPYAQLDLVKFNDDPIIPTGVKVIVLRNVADLSSKTLDSLVLFVARGNTIVLPQITFHKNFDFLAGVKRQFEKIENFEVTGYSFKNNFLPGMNGKKVNTTIAHDGFIKDVFKDDVTVLATSFNDDTYPTILKNVIGNGKVIILNRSLPALKEGRGIIFAAILSGLQGIPYPVVNTGTIFIDDFPTPLYSGKEEPVKREFDLSSSDFYNDVWWPDMLELAKKYQFKYTAIPCFDYRNSIEPPFLFPEWENQLDPSRKIPRPDILMRDVINNNHEMGFHGYNHTSLVETEWNNEDFMVNSLESVVKRWRASKYGPLPRTYVPPSNHIDDIGIDALRKGMPSINIMSSTYMGDFEEGGDREYDPEPYNSDLFDFPRVTSGYVMGNEENFHHQSLFLYTGIWSHFIHPDDIYQIPKESNSDRKGDFEFRNPDSYGWKKSADNSPGLLPRFENYIKKTKSQFPLLQMLTTEDAVDLTKKWRSSQLNYNFDAQQLEVTNNADTEQYWMIYITEELIKTFENHLKIKNLENSATKFHEGKLFMVKTNNAGIKIPKIFLDKTYSSNVDSNSILKDVKRYMSDEIEFASTEEEIAYHVAQDNLPKAIALLKDKIREEPGYLEKDWLALNTYSNWNQELESFWKFLNSEYESRKNLNLVTLSRKLSLQSDFPNLATRKLWMERLIALFPQDAELQKTYDDYFAAPSYFDLSDQDLLQSVIAEQSNKKSILASALIDSNDELARNYFRTLEPCEDEYLYEVAVRIAQSFAYNEEYELAIKWASCSNDVPVKDLSYWLTETGDYEALKNYDYKAYVYYLLETAPSKALQELATVQACNTPALLPISADVAYAYGNIGSYRKALEWSSCVLDFNVKDRMQWSAELGNYDQVFLIYDDYKSKNTKSLELDLFIIDIYKSLNNYDKAFEIISKMTQSSEKNAAVSKINEEFTNIEVKDQEKLAVAYPEIVSEENKNKLKNLLRTLNGSYIETQSNVIADQLIPTSLNNVLSYTFSNKKWQRHTIGITQAAVYKINTNEENPDNRSHELLGVQYILKSKETFKKINYTAGLGIDYDTTDEKLFYDLRAGVSFPSDSLYSSAQLSIKPAITGPAYSLDIYRSQLSIYEELQFSKKYQAVLTMEANHFTDGALDGLLLARLGRKFKTGNSVFQPYVETYGMLGTRDNSNGYPYWTIKERLYGGAGMAYIYKNQNSKLDISLNAAGFLDTFSDSFLRYGGTISYPITAQFIISSNAEVFTLKDFYSNNFSFGLKYYLK